MAAPRTLLSALDRAAGSNGGGKGILDASKPFRGNRSEETGRFDLQVVTGAIEDREARSRVVLQE